jgi:hypothetical protein
MPSRRVRTSIRSKAERPTSAELAGVGPNRRKTASCDETGRIIFSFFKQRLLAFCRHSSPLVLRFYDSAYRYCPVDFQFCAYQIFDQGPPTFHTNSNLLSPAAAKSNGPAKSRTAIVTSSRSVCAVSNRLRRKNAFHCDDFPGADENSAVRPTGKASISVDRRLNVAWTARNRRVPSNS